MIDGKTKTFYDNIIKSKRVTAKELGDYDSFMGKMQDSTRREKVYENLLSRGFTATAIGEKDSFHSTFTNYFKDNNITAALTSKGEDVKIENTEGEITTVTDNEGNRKMIPTHDINKDTVITATKEDVALAEQQAQEPQPETQSIQLTLGNDVVEMSVTKQPSGQIQLDSAFTTRKDAEKLLETLEQTYPMNWEIEVKQTENGFLSANQYQITAKGEKSNELKDSEVVNSTHGENKNITESTTADEKPKTDESDWPAINEKYKDLDWIKRYNEGNKQEIKNEDGTISTHKLAAEVDAQGNWYVFPTIIEVDGELKELEVYDAMDYAIENNQYVPFADKDAAIAYSQNGLIDHREDKEREKAVISAYEERERALKAGNPVDVERAEQDVLTAEAIQTLEDTEKGENIRQSVSEYTPEDMFMTTIPFAQGKEELMAQYGGESERAIDIATEERNVEKNKYYLEKGLGIVEPGNVEINAEIAARELFKDEDDRAVKLIAELRDIAPFEGKMFDKQREAFKNELTKLGYDAEGWMNYKTGQRNKEGSFTGYSEIVNNTIKENTQTPAEELKEIAEKQWVRLHYLQNEYDKADNVLASSRMQGAPYATSWGGALSYQNTKDTAEYKRAQAIHERLGGTKEIAGELDLAKAAFEGITRAYYLNESPESIETSKAHSFGKGVVQGSTILTGIGKLFNADLGVTGAERKQALSLLLESDGYKLTDQDKEALKPTFGEKLSTAAGSTLGVIGDFAALEAVGGVLGIPKIIAGLRTEATAAKATGAAYRTKQLKTFLAESLYEEIKFGAIGGDLGQGTLFGQVGKVMNKVPLLGRKPFDKWYKDIPKSLLKADISMTSSIYAVEGINATADALVDSKEWKYQLQKHFGNDLGEFGERVATDLLTNWMFGIKQTMALSFMDKATLQAEAKYMSKFLKDRGLKEEAAVIEGMVDGFKQGEISGKEVHTRVSGRNKYHSLKQVAFDLSKGKIFNGKEYDAFKKEIDGLIKEYDNKPNLKKIEDLNERADGLKDTWKEETKAWTDYRNEKLEETKRQAEQTKYTEERLIEDEKKEETRLESLKKQEKSTTRKIFERKKEKQERKEEIKELEKDTESYEGKIKQAEEQRKQEDEQRKQKQEEVKAKEDVEFEQKQEALEKESNKEKQQEQPIEPKEEVKVAVESKEVQEKVKQAEKEVNTNPTDKQKELNDLTKDALAGEKLYKYDLSKYPHLFIVPKEFNANVKDALNRMYSKHVIAGQQDINTDDEEAIIFPYIKKMGYASRWAVNKDGKDRLIYFKLPIEQKENQDHIDALISIIDGNPRGPRAEKYKKELAKLGVEYVPLADRHNAEKAKKLQERKDGYRKAIGASKRDRSSIFRMLDMLVALADDAHKSKDINKESDAKEILKDVFGVKYAFRKERTQEDIERMTNNFLGVKKPKKPTAYQLKKEKALSDAPVTTREAVLQLLSMGMRFSQKHFIETTGYKLNTPEGSTANMLFLSKEGIPFDQVLQSSDMADHLVEQLAGENSGELFSEIGDIILSVKSRPEATELLFAAKDNLDRGGLSKEEYEHEINNLKENERVEREKQEGIKKVEIDQYSEELIGQLEAISEKNIDDLTIEQLEVLAQINDYIEAGELETAIKIINNERIEKAPAASKSKKTSSKSNSSTKQEDARKKQSKARLKVKENLSEEKGKRLDYLLNKMKGFSGNINIGINPEQMITAIEISALVIESGSRKFAKFARTMVDAMGDNIKPYLKSLYASVKMSEEAKEFKKDMDSIDGLEDVNIEDALTIEEKSSNLAEKQDDNSRPDTSRKSTPSDNNVVPDGSKKPSGSEQAGGGMVSGTPSSDVSKSKQQGDSSDSGSGVTPTRKTDVKTDSKGVRDTGTRGKQSEGSSALDAKGVSVDGRPNSESRTDVDALKEDLGDNSHLAGIKKDVPELYPDQQMDVLKAEKRFDKGKGILFTNATGSGKTFTGLGIMKRFILKGKSNIVLVVPSQPKLEDWVEDAEVLGIKITKVENIKDAPKGVVITTYANMYQNENLQNRDSDLVLYDEVHKLGQGKKGDITRALEGHAKLANLPSHAKAQAKEAYPTPERPKEGTAELEKWYENNKLIEKKRAEYAKQLVNSTKTVMLSATPFAYHKSLILGDGTLFEFNETLVDVEVGGYYNEAIGFNKFLVENLGYRMRTGQLNAPEAEVNVGLLERSLYDKLVKEGVVSGRKLKEDKDYSREFIQIDSELADKINEGYKIVKSHDQEFKKKYPVISERIGKKLNYLYTNQLLESLKAKQAAERIKDHLAEGRKVVVFHGYNNNLPAHPFQMTTQQLLGKPNENATWQEKRQRTNVVKEIEAFNKEYPDLVNLDLSELGNTRETLKNALGEQAVEFNGTVPSKKRERYIKEFQDDNSNTKVLIVQRAAGKEGISLHDVTGVHQRAIVDLGLPTAPTDAIQSEGRIYRLGLKSNAIMEYIIVGTDFERLAFATKVAERSRTAENLAMGFAARELDKAFVDGYQNAHNNPASESTGEGGKEADKAQEGNISPFDASKTYYYARGKKTASTKSAEGVDYYATPEPIGIKMVEWLGLSPNESALEPSAGHGAIARFFPSNTKNTFIEPSYGLATQVGMNANGDVKQQSFEELNKINKYDGIAMNPPYGKNSKTAMEHVEKAFGHLREGGRIVAIVPAGPSMEKRLEKFLYGVDEKGKPLNPNAVLRATINLPSSTFKRAATSVNTNIIVIDNIKRSEEIGGASNMDLRFTENIEQLFDELEYLSVPDRVQKEEVIEVVPESVEQEEDVLQYAPHPNTRTGRPTHKVVMASYLGTDKYLQLKANATKHAGYYSKYHNKSKGIRAGFIFSSEQDALDYIADSQKIVSEPSAQYKVSLDKQSHDEKIKELEAKVKQSKALSDKARNKYYRLREKANKEGDAMQIDMFGNAPTQGSLDLGAENKADVLKSAQKEMTIAYQDYINDKTALEDRQGISPHQTSMVFEKDLFGNYSGQPLKMEFDFESQATPEMKKEWQENDYTSGVEVEVSEVFSERILGETGMTLSGTPSIKSSTDVAFLFRHLEDAAVENLFAVYIDKNGSYKVQHLSIGGTAGTIVDMKMIAAGIAEFKPESITVVHNHPSGSLQVSPEDRRMQSDIEKMGTSLGVTVNPHVIINLDSGQYAEFASGFDNYEITPNTEHEYRKPRAQKVTVYSFGKQKLYKPSNKKTKIRTSQEVATYLSKMKRGTTPKIGALILARDNSIVKSLLFDETTSLEDLSSQLIKEVAKHGENVILHTNTKLQPTAIEELRTKLRTAACKLLDVITSEAGESVLASYTSAVDDGVLMDQQADYLKVSESITKELALIEKRYNELPEDTSWTELGISQQGNTYGRQIGVNKHLEAVAEYIMKGIEGLGYTDMFLSKAGTGSMYVKYNEGDVIRISDHYSKDVRNYAETIAGAKRILSEIPSKEEYDQIVELRKKRDAEAKKVMDNKLSKFKEDLADMGLVFVKNNRTYQSREEFLKNKPNARFVKQIKLNKGAFAYEYLNTSDHPQSVTEDYLNWYLDVKNGQLADQKVKYLQTNEPYTLHSGVEQSLHRIRQAKGSPQQFKAMMLKNGAKQAELDWMGFDLFADGKISITKEELQEWVEANKIELEEVVKGDHETGLVDMETLTEEAQELVDKYQEDLKEWVSIDDHIRQHYEESERYNIEEYATYAEKLEERRNELEEEYGDIDNLIHVRDVIYQDADNFELEIINDTEYSRQQTKGGENYKEWLLTMPQTKADVKVLTQLPKGYSIIESEGKYGVIKDTQLHARPITGFHYDTEAEAIEKSLVMLNGNSRQDAQNEAEELDFTSAHFGEPNIVVHGRTNERVDTEENTTLHVEEIQSDWAQEGRKKGFEFEKNNMVLTESQHKDLVQLANEDSTNKERGKYTVNNTSFDREEFYLNDSDGNPIADFRDIGDDGKKEYDIPDMPFKKTPQWAGLMLKKLTQEAARGGFDKLTWTTGKTQAERYDLSKQVDEVTVKKKGEHSYSISVVTKDGHIKQIANDIAQDKISDYIGKDLAEKAINDTKKDHKVHYSGIDLRVGGEGMIAFYDKMLPSIANKLFKKYGVKVSTSEIVIGKNETLTVHSINITPELAKAAKEGMPTFLLSERPKEPATAAEMITDEYVDAFNEFEKNAREEIGRTAKSLGVNVNIHVSEDTVPRKFILNDKDKAENDKLGRWRLGFYDASTGEVHIVLGNVHNIKDATRVVVHEVVGHKGVHAVLGNEYDKFMESIYDKLTDDDKKAIYARGYDKDDHKTIAEEWVAMRSEYEVKPNWFKRIWAKMRSAVRKMFNLEFTNEDMDAFLHELFRAGRKAVKNNKHDTSTAKGLFNTLNNTNTKGDAFKSWFGESKVVDADGEPLVVYHGTDRVFSEFDSYKFKTAGYFAKDARLAGDIAELVIGPDDGLNAGANIIPVYLSIKNPVDLSALKSGYENISAERFLKALPFKADKAFEGAVLKEKNAPLFAFIGESYITDYFASKGYDGVIFNEVIPEEAEALSTGESYVAFNPNQIKSATGNSGEYSKTDNNINNLYAYKSPLVEEFEKQKDRWIGEKDWQREKAIVESDGYQRRIKEIAKEKKTAAKDWKELSQAINIYADMLQFPDKLTEYEAEISKLKGEKKRIVEASQNLSPEAKQIAEEIIAEDRELGEYALEHGVIGNVIEGHIGRVWDMGKKSNAEFWRRFGTKTSRRKKRKLETIIDGWFLKDEDGEDISLELKIKGIANNLAQSKKDIYTVIANNEFLDSGLAYVDGEGNSLFTTKRGEEDYVQINHPSFVKWTRVGQLKPDLMEPKPTPQELAGDMEGFEARYDQWEKDVMEKQPSLNIEAYGNSNTYITPKGVVLQKREIFAPKPVAERINNILDPISETHPVLAELWALNQVVKKTILMASFFHHQAFIRSYMLTVFTKSLRDLNFVKGYKDGLRMMQDLTPEFELLVRNGLTVGLQQEWNELIIQQSKFIGKVLDKHNIATPIRKKVNELFEKHTHFLFATLGAGLKMKTAAIELRHHVAKNPDADINELAKEIADMVNADFGGLHLDRMERRKDTQRMARNWLLAPDWTESNVLTMVRAFGYDYSRQKGEKWLKARERKLYRRFWTRAVTRAATASFIMNLILAMFDGDEDDDYIDTVIERYKDAFQDPEKLNWLKMDITPLYKGINKLTDQEIEEDVRKYYSVLGHFQDPYKWAVEAGSGSWTTPIKHKGSWIATTALNLITGSTWNSRRYTSAMEFLGWDDKGTYSTNKMNPKWREGDPYSEKYEHMILDPKGGKHKGEFTKWDYTEHGGTKTNAIGSFIAQTAVGMTPIIVQNLIGVMNGEMEYFDAISRGLGGNISTAKIRQDDRHLEYDEKYRAARNIINLAKTYKKDNKIKLEIEVRNRPEYKEADKLIGYHKDVIMDLEKLYDEALKTADEDLIDEAEDRIKEYKIKYLK